MTTQIVLVRHGATKWNDTHRAQGQADVDLNDLGRGQALALVDALAGYEIAAIYASDLRRALDTAAPLARARRQEVREDPRLREIDQGEWEGLTSDEIRRRWPALWGPARHYSARPGGESPAQVRRRALAALEDIARDHPGQTVVVVSHGGTIRAVSGAVLGYDDVESARLRGVLNGGAVVFHAAIDDDGHLVLSDFTRMDGRSPDEP